MSSATILLVDDDLPFRRNLVRLCRQARRTYGFEIREISEAGTFAEAHAAIERHRPDIAFLDFMLPRTEGGSIRDCGFELLRRLRAANPRAEAIMMSAVRDDASSAVEALTEQGAYYFFVKDRFDSSQVQRVLYQAIEKQRLVREQERVRRRPGYFVVGAEASSPLADFVGSSPQIGRLRQVVKRVAAGDIHVLITGETGTGKELLARAIHYHSPRRQHPFVPVNCSAVPESLWESQFFGHSRGAFTGADSDHSGFFAEAGEGTLFLDEVGEIPLSSQAKILRVLEDGTFRPLSASRDRAVEARIVAATKVPLEEMVADGSFRDDLYFRLEGFQLRVPRLADRGDDVVEIATVLLERHARNMGKKGIGLGPGVAPLFRAHGWPGNVRELSNLMERCVLMLDAGEPVTPELLREQGAAFDRGGRSEAALRDRVATWKHQPEGEEKAELGREIRAILERALDEAGGQVARASRRLGLSRGTFYRYRDAFGIGDTR